MKRGEKNNLKVSSIILGIFIIGCAPTNPEHNGGDSSKGLSGEELEERNDECKL